MQSELVQTGQILKELRESQTALMPEEVPLAMARAGIARDRIPSSRTVRRIEDGKVWPRLRYRAGLAEFYARDLHQLWPAKDPKR
jgi:hypothetical protein